MKKIILSEKQEQLLNKVKQMFPVGTVINSMFGATDIIDSENFYFPQYEDCTLYDTILVKCKDSVRVIYDNGNYADIINKPLNDNNG